MQLAVPGKTFVASVKRAFSDSFPVLNQGGADGEEEVESGQEGQSVFAVLGLPENIPSGLILINYGLITPGKGTGFLEERKEGGNK